MREQQYDDNRISEAELKAYLHDFLQIAAHKLVLLAVLIAAAAGILCLREWRSYSPRYQATATFTVYVSNPLQSDVRAYNTSTAEQMAKTFPYILTSNALQDIVRRELQITRMPEISATVLENTNIFTLKVTADDPQLASDVLEVVMTYYPEISEFVVGPTIMSLLDESGTPTAPMNPRNYKHAVRNGILIGTALWLVFCAIQTVIRSTVHSEDELKRLLNVRCLGILPRVRGREKDALCPLQGKEVERSGFTEAVRLTRIRTEKELREHHTQVLVISSAMAGEGKTTVSLNLACSLAAHGNRTLLIDCDLRNPSVAAYLGKKNGDGITELLEGTATPRKILRESGQKDLYVIYAGGPSGNAAELLAKPEFADFIKMCRKSFEYIILDTSPVLLLSDVSELVGSADGAVLTIRENYAARREIRESAQLLADEGLPLLGCVLNNASVGVLSSYGGKYGYGKYYGNYREAEETGASEG